MEPFNDMNVVLTPELLEALAQELGVRWPQWYRELVLALLTPSGSYVNGWLPGGFLYAMPALIYRDTTYWRNNVINRWLPSGQREESPWPAHHVVVGGCGDGDIVIDTSSDRQLFLNLYKEDYALRPFFDLVTDVKMSPREFAQHLQEDDRKSKEE